MELVAADTVNIKMLPPTDYCQAAASRTYAFADGVEDLTCLPPEAISRSLLEQGTWQLSTWRSSFYFVQLNAIMPRDSERMLREVQVFHCDLDIGKGGVRVNVHEIDEQRMRVPYDPDGVLRERYHKALDGLSSTPPLPAQPASVPPPPPVKPPLPQPPTPAAPQDAAALKPSTATRSTADRGREPISRAAKLFPGFKPPLPTTDS